MQQWTDLEIYKGRNGLFSNDTVFALEQDANPVTLTVPSLWWKIWARGSGLCPELTTVAIMMPDLAHPVVWGQPQPRGFEH